jgi:formylglycine-generating enzyme required for sulfatase activity
MIKGGSWGSAPADVRPAQRGRDPSDYRANYIGFRVVADIP